MNEHGSETERRRNAAPFGVWENGGGAQGRDCLDRQFGRRVEADRSWTVYHVFTGVPARSDGQAMIGLSRSDATQGMFSLNGHDAARRTEWTSQSAPVATGCCETAMCPS